MSERAPSPRLEALRLAATLTVAGLLSGLAIVGTYRVSLPRIQANQAEALRRAVFEVLPGSERMERLSWQDGRLTVAAAAGDSADSIFAGYDAAGALTGYAVPAAGAGFQDTIKLIYGLDPTGARVIGMAILESRETPGLGDKIFKDADFVAEFRDLATDPEIAVIKGHGEAAHEVDAITGATISSIAVIRILNAGNRIWRPRLPAPDGAPEPGAAQSPAVAVPRDVERGGPVPAVPARPAPPPEEGR